MTLTRRIALTSAATALAVLLAVLHHRAWPAATDRIDLHGTWRILSHKVKNVEVPAAAGDSVAIDGVTMTFAFQNTREPAQPRALSVERSSHSQEDGYPFQISGGIGAGQRVGRPDAGRVRARRIDPAARVVHQRRRQPRPEPAAHAVCRLARGLLGPTGACQVTKTRTPALGKQNAPP